jgi:hypothetical protein
MFIFLQPLNATNFNESKPPKAVIPKLFKLANQE